MGNTAPSSTHLIKYLLLFDLSLSHPDFIFWHIKCSNTGMSHGNRRTIALAVWGDILSPVFDAARTVLIANIEDGNIRSTRAEALGPEQPYSRASRLSEWGVEVLICGAISTDFARMLERSGIELIGFVSGNARQVLEAYLRKMPIGQAFRMPGCLGQGRRRRFRGGRE